MHRQTHYVFLTPHIKVELSNWHQRVAILFVNSIVHHLSDQLSHQIWLINCILVPSEVIISVLKRFILDSLNVHEHMIVIEIVKSVEFHELSVNIRPLTVRAIMLHLAMYLSSYCFRFEADLSWVQWINF